MAVLLISLRLVKGIFCGTRVDALALEVELVSVWAWASSSVSESVLSETKSLKSLLSIVAHKSFEIAQLLFNFVKHWMVMSLTSTRFCRYSLLFSVFNDAKNVAAFVSNWLCVSIISLRYSSSFILFFDIFSFKIFSFNVSAFYSFDLSPFFFRSLCHCFCFVLVDKIHLFAFFFHLIWFFVYFSIIFYIRSLNRRVSALSHFYAIFYLNLLIFIVLS